MDPITIIAAIRGAIGIVEAIRMMVKAGQVKNLDGSVMTASQLEGFIADARTVTADGIAIAERELGGG